MVGDLAALASPKTGMSAPIYAREEQLCKAEHCQYASDALERHRKSMIYYDPWISTRIEALREDAQNRQASGNRYAI